MPGGVSKNVRNAVWLMMTDRSFRQAALAGQAKQAANDRGIRLTDSEAAMLQSFDPQDLKDMLAYLERSIDHTQGGSRPRTLVELSDETIAELRAALRRAK